jgi:peptide/nickel transport system permease protein
MALSCVALTLLVLCAPRWFVPDDGERATDFLPPGARGEHGQSYVLGTDYLGRPFAPVLMHGLRATLQAAVAGTLAVVGACLVLGIFHGSTQSRLLERLLSAGALGVLALPEAAVLITVGNAWPRTAASATVNLTMMAVLIAFAIPTGARLVAERVRAVNGSGFVAASRAYGATYSYIFRKDVWPHLIDDVTWIIAAVLPRFIAAEVGLAYLGVEYREFEGLGKVLKKSFDYLTVPTATTQLTVTILVVLWAAVLPQVVLRAFGVRFGKKAAG